MIEFWSLYFEEVTSMRTVFVEQEEFLSHTSNLNGDNKQNKIILMKHADVNNANLHLTSRLEKFSVFSNNMMKQLVLKYNTICNKSRRLLC